MQTSRGQWTNPAPQPTFGIGGYTPFPARKLCTLTYTRYAQTLTNNVSAGLLGAKLEYNLNSLYQPDLTNAATQPYYWDQLTALYSRYRVRKCRVTITVFDTVVSASYMLAILESSNNAITTVGVALNALADRPYTEVICLAGSGNGVERKLSYVFDLSQVEGLSHSQYDAEDGYQATMSQNPSRVISLAVASSGSSSEVINFNIELQMVAELSEIKFVAQST